MVMKRPLVIRWQAFMQRRIRHAHTAPDRGASAGEWVIITAIIAGVAFGLATCAGSAGS